MFQSYHLSWLEAHPHRSMAWLLFKLREGFDVHHIDGDHGNDAPENLVLIEHSDHMALHNGGHVHIGRLLAAKPKARRAATPEAAARRRRRARARAAEVFRACGLPVPDHLLS